jgi:Bacterial surface proteins containing Ig-like domains
MKANTSPTPSVTPRATPGTTATPTTTVDGIHVKGLSIDKETMELTVGQSANLTVSVEPSAAEKKTIAWSSGNDSIAAVSKTNDTTATITANTVGTVLIKAASEDGGRLAACIITVKSATVDVTGVTLSTTSTTMTLGSTIQVTASIAPANATNKALEWSSSSPNIAMASEDGTIVATGIGTAVITVKTVNGGKTATCTVRVKEAVTGISVSPTAQSMKIGDKLNLTASVFPASADRPKLIWSSSNSNVAAVTDGSVTAKAVGESIITVKTEDGKFSATCTVYVSR